MPAKASKAGVSALLVPPATGNDAVITVKVGGNRTSLTAVGNLAGVTLGFYDTPTGGAPAFTCVSDADGDCSITVPNTQPVGANRDRRFWVRQISTAAGHYTNPELGTGETVATDPYRFQTGTQLRAGTTYRSTVDFMISTGTSNNEASGGIWQNSLDNPTFPAKCGINVALVLDLSNSVTNAQLVQLKAAANGFVDALTGTASQVGTFTFATSAPANSGDTLPLTPVSTPAGATLVKNRISGYNKPGGNAGGTNWDRGIFQVAQSTSTFDVAVVITDGNPTFYAGGEGPGSRTRFREVENGIFSANAIKAENTKVIAFGVGDGVGNSGSGLNLRSISGPTLNSDYYQTTDYQDAGDQLRELALGNCTGSITVVKQVVPSTAPPGTTTGATPAGGWTFAGTGSTDVIFDAPTSRVTAAGTGAANFPLTFTSGATTGPVTLSETLQPGYTLQQVGGDNAVCTRIDTGASVPVTNTGATGFTVNAASTFPVSCTVYNRTPNPSAQVVLNKTWVVNGISYAEGTQPPGLIAAGTIDGTTQPWGVPRGGFTAGDSVALDESLSTPPTQCTLDSSRLTSANGTTVDLPLPSNQTLASDLNAYGITNVLTCPTKLTLAKAVRFGDAASTLWTLDAVAPAGAEPGPNGISGSAGATASVTPAVTYPLAESGGPPQYAQVVDPNANLIPGSSGTWNCVEVAKDGTTEIPGFADGLNGGVTVPFGTWVRCTAINESALLTLVKEVVNDNGGTAVPSDWDLTAAPTGTFPPGLPVETHPGAAFEDAVQFNVRPGVDYDLSESGGPPGYTNTAIECEVASPRVETTHITLKPGDRGVCFFTNDDRQARLTLLKTVVNDNGGTAVDTDWTLSADGPTQGVSGIEGDPAITNAPVDAGDYTLAETNGPAGYTATAWTCQNAAGDPVTVTNATVPVAVGDNLTCTITNNDQAPVWTVAKSSDPESGTTVSPGSLITYTITATETGDVDPTGVVVTDNLTDVLAHATLVDGSLDPSTGNADVMGDSLVWNIDTLAGTQTLSYTVRVNDNAFDVTLRNAITATGSEPPEHCAGGIVPDAAVRVGTAAEASDPCSTTHTTPPEPPPAPGPQPGPGPGLPNTGGPSAALTLGGLLLVGTGISLLLRSRRRRTRI